MGLAVTTAPIPDEGVSPIVGDQLYVFAPDAVKVEVFTPEQMVVGVLEAVVVNVLETVTTTVLVWVQLVVASVPVTV